MTRNKAVCYTPARDERINQLQAEINAKLEVLKASNNPVQRRDLMIALKKLFGEIDRLVSKRSEYLSPMTCPSQLAETNRKLEEAEVALRADFREPYNYERRQRLVEGLRRARDKCFELLKKQRG